MHDTMNERLFDAAARQERVFDAVAIPAFAIGFTFFFSALSMTVVSTETGSLLFLSVVNIVSAVGILSTLLVSIGVFSATFRAPIDWLDMLLLTLMTLSLLMASLLFSFASRSNDMRAVSLLGTTCATFVFLLASVPRFFTDIELKFAIPVLASFLLFHASAATLYTFVAEENESVQDRIRRLRRLRHQRERANA